MDDFIAFMGMAGALVIGINLGAWAYAKRVQELTQGAVGYRIALPLTNNKSSKKRRVRKNGRQ